MKKLFIFVVIMALYGAGKSGSDALDERRAFERTFQDDTPSTFVAVTPARHRCINMVRGSRKLGSGSMIGGTTNYRFTNKSKRYGEQSVVCGIHADTHELVTVRVDGALIYNR